MVGVREEFGRQRGGGKQDFESEEPGVIGKYFSTLHNILQRRKRLRKARELEVRGAESGRFRPKESFTRQAAETVTIFK